MIRLYTLLSTFILCIVSYSLKGQNGYHFQLEEVSLVEVIDTLSHIANCEFSFPSSLLKNNDRKSFIIDDTNLNTVLDQVFTDFDVEYLIANSNHVLLRAAEKTVSQQVDKRPSEKIVTGYINQAEAAQPVEYAAVAIPAHNEIAFSDEMGMYSLNVANIPQEAEVTIHMLGFEIHTTSVDELIREKDFDLHTKPIEIEEITILETTPGLIVNAEKLTLKKTAFDNLGIGLVGNDIMRRIQMLPGIDATDDSSTDIKIRGSNADETLIIMDGIPLYNSSHYYGIFSSINTDYIEEVNIYKNTQPIEYGNKTAGVVEFNSGQKAIDKIGGKLNLNLLESSITFHAPVTKNSHFQLSGRKTFKEISNTTFNSIGQNRRQNNRENLDTQNYINRENVISSEPSFDFWDLQAKYFMEINLKNTLEINFFESKDNFSNEISENFSIRKDEKQFRSDEEIKTSEIWKNTGFGIDWDSQLNPKYSLSINSYYSNYNIENSTDSKFNIFETELPNLSELFKDDQTQFNQVKDLGTIIQLNKTGDMWDIRAGVNAVNHQTEFSISLDKENLLNQIQTSSEVTVYSEVTNRLSDYVQINSGMRVHYYSESEALYYSPQLSLTADISQHFQIKGSIGKNHQFLRELSVESNFGNIIDRWVLADGNKIPVSSSINSMLGATLKKNKLVLDAELFYKKMNNVTEVSLAVPILIQNNMMNAMMDGPAIFVGEGRSYGLDLLLAFESKFHTSQIAYTLSKVEHSFRAINRGQFFDAPNDRTHQLKLINEFSFDPFEVTINYNYATGRTFTDLDKLVDIRDFDRVNTNPKNFRSRLPSYHRFDLSLNYNFTVQELPVSIGMGVFNLFDSQNVKYQQQIVGTNARTESPLKNIVLGTNSDLLGRTLNLSFAVKF